MKSAVPTWIQCDQSCWSKNQLQRIQKYIEGRHQGRPQLDHRQALEPGHRLEQVQGHRLELEQGQGHKLELEQVQEHRLVLEQVPGHKLEPGLGHMQVQVLACR